MRYLLLLLLPMLCMGQTATRVILNGGPYTDSNGKVWSTDTACSGAPVYTSTALIGGTPDMPLFQTGRYGTGPLGCTYTVTNALFYNIVLNFANTQSELLGQNLFNIYINHVQYRAGFDVTNGPGGCITNQPCNINQAVSLAFGPIAVSNGEVNIVLAQSSGNVILSSISIVLYPIVTAGAATTSSWLTGAATAQLTLTTSFQDVADTGITLDQTGFWLLTANVILDAVAGGGTIHTKIHCTAEDSDTVVYNPQGLVTVTFFPTSYTFLYNGTTADTCVIQGSQSATANGFINLPTRLNAVWVHP